MSPLLWVCTLIVYPTIITYTATKQSKGLMQRPPEWECVSRKEQNQRVYVAAKEAIRRLNSPDLGMRQLKEHYRAALGIEFDELVKKVSKRNIRLLRKHFVNNGMSFCSDEFVDAVFVTVLSTTRRSWFSRSMGFRLRVIWLPYWQR